MTEFGGEDDGAVIWTRDLFKLLKTEPDEGQKVEIRRSIREARGRWTWPPSADAEEESGADVDEGAEDQSLEAETEEGTDSS